MIFGAHIVLYSRDPDADRAFLRDTLQLSAVDAGHGWLIFALPPTEAAIHPLEGAAAATQQLYLLTTDLPAEIDRLSRLGVSCSEVQQARWGSITQIRLPGGGDLGLYQPRHPLAIPQPVSD